MDCVENVEKLDESWCKVGDIVEKSDGFVENSDVFRSVLFRFVLVRLSVCLGNFLVFR